jgi:type IV pilus assembly protein PilX
MQRLNPLRSRLALQQGVALVIALVLLLAVTLVGLAAIRGTAMQEKMASNLYDRDIALQNAEAALRVAAARVTDTTAVIWHDCSIAGTICNADPTLVADDEDVWQTVASSSEYTAAATAAGQPQYVIENMGLWPNPTGNTGVNLSGSAAQYGAQGVSLTVNYYRMTARSSDPTTSGNRSLVTLQAWIKR